MSDYKASPWLKGWKSIAAYMGVHVRTAKHYHYQHKMPIHKMPGQASASVIALPAQLDQWLIAYSKQRNDFIEQLRKKNQPQNIPQDLH